MSDEKETTMGDSSVKKPTTREDSNTDSGTTISKGNSTTEAKGPERRRSMDEIKAEARAYALSSTTSSKKRVPSWQKGLPKQLASQLAARQQQQQAAARVAPPAKDASASKKAPPQQPANHSHPPPAYPAPGRYPHHPYQHAPPPHGQHTSPPPNPHYAHPYYHPLPPSAGGPAPSASGPPPSYPYHYPPPYYHPQHTAAAYVHPQPASSAPRQATAKTTASTATDRSSSGTTPQYSTAPTSATTAATKSVAAAEPVAGADVVNKATDRQVSWTAERLLRDENLDDYDRLLKGLNLLEVDDVLRLFQDDDDEDEYNLHEEDAGDDEDEEENDGEKKQSFDSEKTEEKKEEAWNGNGADAAKEKVGILEDLDAAIYRELEEELGWLEEEDIEAAVASLVDHGKSEDANVVGAKATKGVGSGGGEETKKKSKSAAAQNARTVAGAPSYSYKQRVVVTADQHKQMSHLLQKHYQLLVQQSVLTVRAAHYHKYHRSRTDRMDFLAGGETADDLVEILDAAVGMLQDLRQNRKDAIRHHLQFGQQVRPTQEAQLGAKQPTTPVPTTASGNVVQADSPMSERRLTRSQFHRTLAEQSKSEQSAHTIFDIRGLLKMDDTFTLIDKSVQHDENNDQPQLLELDSNKEACEHVLGSTNQRYEKSLIPGSRDISQNFCDPREFLGPQFKPPCDEKHQAACRRNRNLFTAGEDNLVLRGVNLYGEKQWMLISDRFLPERSTNIISQRYSKLCLLLYKANGIWIDGNGQLKKPPKLESIDDICEKEISKLRPVQAPAILNVHRWSLEEDLTLLKAVPITGHMWAELGARLIPHRDRGHLRKRYQVLERRIKSTVERSNKLDYMKTIAESTTKTARGAAESKRSGESKPSDTGGPAPTAACASTPPRSNPAQVADKTSAATVDAANSLKSPNANAAGHGPSAGVPPHHPPAAHMPHHYSPHHPPAYPYPYPVYGSPYHAYPYPPHPYSPYHSMPHPFHDPYMGEEGSRAAFEKLAKEGPDGPKDGASAPEAASTGWSQMSDLIKTENEVASAMAVDLARSPSKASATKPTEEENAREAAKESVGLLAGVLERSKKNDESSQGSEPKDDPAKKTDAVDVATPAKRTKAETRGSEPSPADETKDRKSSPRRDPSKGAIYTTDGAQIGLSPAFQPSPGQHAWPKLSVMPSPAMANLSMASFPPTSQMVGFSPPEHASPAAELTTPPAHSLDSVALQHLDQSGQSAKRKALFQDVPSTLSANDLEAISGLNLMASSPAAPPASVTAESSTKKRKASSSSSEGKSSKKSSLFAKVVGEKESKKNDRKKRKLVF